MRITKRESEQIKNIVQRYRPLSCVYLFGSRTDDAKKGGDIDILVLAEDRLEIDDKLNILYDLNSEILEQKYDIVSFSYDEHSAFKDHILEHAIKL
jgi:predicted nucleotidyltransferase